MLITEGIQYHEVMQFGLKMSKPKMEIVYPKIEVAYPEIEVMQPKIKDRSAGNTAQR